MTRPEPWFWKSAEEFEKLKLSKGQHETPEDGLCVMEAVAWVAGEEHNDLPKCVHGAIGLLAQRINDHGDDEDREKLKRLIPAMIGTNSCEVDMSLVPNSEPFFMFGMTLSENGKSVITHRSIPKELLPPYLHLHWNNLMQALEEANKDRKPQYQLPKKEAVAV